MTMTSHDHYAELVVGHALSALEPEDEQTLLGHLSSCALCSRELVAARDVLAQVAYAAPAIDPPADLFDTIRDRIQAFAPDAFTPRASVVALGPVRARRLQTRAARLVSVAAVVALAAVIGLGAWNVSLHRDNRQQGQLSAAASAAVRALEVAPGQTVPLVDPTSKKVTSLAVIHADRLSLVVDGLAPNDKRTSTYVLWGQYSPSSGNAGLPYALAAFDVTGPSVDVLRDLPSTVGSPPDVLMITKEAGRRMPLTPTLPVLAVGRTA